MRSHLNVKQQQQRRWREKERERNDNKLLVTLRAVAAFERSRS